MKKDSTAQSGGRDKDERLDELGTQGGKGGQPAAGGSGGQSNWDTKGGTGPGAEAGRTGGAVADSPLSGKDR